MMPTTASGGHHRFMTLTPWRRRRPQQKPLRITFWIDDKNALGPMTLEEIHLVQRIIPGSRISITPTLSISVDR